MCSKAGRGSRHTRRFLGGLDRWTRTPGTRGVRPRRRRGSGAAPAPARGTPCARRLRAARARARPHRPARRRRLPAHRQPRRRQRDRALPARRAARPRPRKRTPPAERAETAPRRRGRPCRRAPRAPAAAAAGARRGARAAGTAARPRPLRPAHRARRLRAAARCSTPSPRTARASRPTASSGSPATAAPPTDLLYELFAAVYSAPLYRPDRDELLDARAGDRRGRRPRRPGVRRQPRSTSCSTPPPSAPSCSPPPPTSRRPSADSAPRRGLPRRPRAAPPALELLERAVGRPLDRGRGELGGRPLVRVRGPAAALRPGGRAAAAARRGCAPAPRPPTSDVPTTSASDVAADGRRRPAAVARRGRGPRRAARLPAQRVGPRRPCGSPSRSAARCPHQAHLPALVGDTHADAALGELLACGLRHPRRPPLPAGRRCRRPSWRPPGTRDDAAEAAGPHRRPALRLVGRPPLGRPGARRAPRRTPSSPRWPPWCRARRPGHAERRRAAGPQRRARLRRRAALGRLGTGPAGRRRRRPGSPGEVAEEAYFHHELGVLALCTRQPRPGPRRAGGVHRPARRARRQARHRRGPPGAGAGRRPRGRGDAAASGRAAAGRRCPDAGAGRGRRRPRAGGVPARRTPVLAERRDPRSTSATRGHATATPTVRRSAGRRAARRPGAASRAGARRNLVAAGAGALLVAVLGTVVTLGATSRQRRRTRRTGPGRRQPVGERRTTDDGSLGADPAANERGRRHRRGDQPPDRPRRPDGTLGSVGRSDADGRTAPSHEPRRTPGDRRRSRRRPRRAADARPTAHDDAEAAPRRPAADDPDAADLRTPTQRPEPPTRSHRRRPTSPPPSPAPPTRPAAPAPSAPDGARRLPPSAPQSGGAGTPSGSGHGDRTPGTRQGPGP